MWPAPLWTRQGKRWRLLKGLPKEGGTLILIPQSLLQGNTWDLVSIATREMTVLIAHVEKTIPGLLFFGNPQGCLNNSWGWPC